MTHVCYPHTSCVQSFSKFPPKPFVFSPITRPFSMVSPISKKVYHALSNEEAHKTLSFKEYHAKKEKSVNQALDKIVPNKEPQKIHDAMRYSLSGGPRLLPVICIAACELVGGEESVAMPAACAIEMLAALANVHDDLPCVDNADLRRGIPTTHKVFSEGIAIYAGDAFHALSFEHLAKFTDGVPANRILRVMGELANGMGSEGMCGGQVAEMETAGLANVSLDQVDFMYYLKTANFFGCVPAIGVILGGGSDEQIEKLRKYGGLVGRMLQVTDDIMDAEKDTIEDRATYLKLLGVEKSWEFVKNMSKEANDCLAGFDQKRAAPLISLVNGVAKGQFFYDLVD